MARMQEMSVYLEYEDKQAVEKAAKEQGYETTSEYVRDHLPECGK